MPFNWSIFFSSSILFVLKFCISFCNSNTISKRTFLSWLEMWEFCFSKGCWEISFKIVSCSFCIRFNSWIKIWIWLYNFFASTIFWSMFCKCFWCFDFASLKILLNSSLSFLFDSSSLIIFFFSFSSVLSCWINFWSFWVFSCSF